VVVVGPSLAGLHAELSPLAQPRWFGWANEAAKPTETLRPIIQTTWTPPKD
jgi:hypothetical protein